MIWYHYRISSVYRISVSKILGSKFKYKSPSSGLGFNDTGDCTTHRRWKCFTTYSRELGRSRIVQNRQSQSVSSVQQTRVSDMVMSIVHVFIRARMYVHKGHQKEGRWDLCYTNIVQSEFSRLKFWVIGLSLKGEPHRWSFCHRWNRQISPVSPVTTGEATGWFRLGVSTLLANNFGISWLYQISF